MVDWHLLALGTLSPFVLNLVEEAGGGDCLILPDFGKSDILTLMNLVQWRVSFEQRGQSN